MGDGVVVLSTLLYFVLMLVPLVLVHEFGHYIVARWMGVQVVTFSIGFGHVLWSWTRNGTEYTIRALPLGGYVRMLGDDPQSNCEHCGPAAPGSFLGKPVWRRSLIVAAGPVFNFLFAGVLLFAGALIFDREVMSTRLGTVLADGPAHLAGLRPGDRVLGVNGVAWPRSRSCSGRCARTPTSGCASRWIATAARRPLR